MATDTRFFGSETETYYVDRADRVWCVQSPDLREPRLCTLAEVDPDAYDADLDACPSEGQRLEVLVAGARWHALRLLDQDLLETGAEIDARAAADAEITEVETTDGEDGMTMISARVAIGHRAWRTTWAAVPRISSYGEDGLTPAGDAPACWVDHDLSVDLGEPAAIAIGLEVIAMAGQS